MTSERIQTRVDHLLNLAEKASDGQDWQGLADRAQEALALDESNAYAQRLTLAAERMVSRSWMRDPFLDGWMRTPWRLTLGVYHVVIAVLLGYLLFEFWQTQDRTSDGELPSASISIFGSDMTVHPEVQLIAIVVIAAGIGSYAHAATSFSGFVGNRQLEKSWLWWCLPRPFIGAALALTIYFLTRGGLLSTGSWPGDLNLFGIAGLSALSGMFSKQATHKLKEVFDSLFGSPPDLTGKLHN